MARTQGGGTMLQTSTFSNRASWGASLSVLTLLLGHGGCLEPAPVSRRTLPTDQGAAPTLQDSSAPEQQDGQATVPPAADQTAPGSPADAYFVPDTPPASASDTGTGPHTNVNLTADEQDLVDAINDARVELGLNTVTPDARLMCAARMHVLDVGATGACGHVGSDGSWPWDRADYCGYPQGDEWTVNEIAAGPGFVSGEEAVWGWSQSPGHWAGLTHNQATLIGVGVHQSCYIAVFDCCVAQM